MQVLARRRPARTFPNPTIDEEPDDEQDLTIRRSGSPRWAWLACGAALAQTKEVTIAHQDMLGAVRIVMESGELEKATGYKINWRMFGGGGDVIRAMASGDVQIGEVGSAGITAAASQGQDIKLFWILDDIADAEALVARNGSGINSVKDLKGKKVATPFVSTSHYQLMADMKSEGVDPKGVNVMNMRPPEIAAAWERGDIDATFIWDPVLSKIKANGKVIATSGIDRQEGLPDLRRHRRQRQVGRGQRGLHGRLRQGAGQGRCRVPCQRREVDGRFAAGQGSRQVDQGRRRRTCRRRWRSNASRRWPSRSRRRGSAAAPPRR